MLPNPKDDGKKLPDVTRRRLPSVDIPKDMTPEHYYGMNLLPGHRIGMEYKEGYIARLSELYIQGYLTEEEYDKRTSWVNAAQTSEQIEIAFLDLQSSLLGLKVQKYLSEKKPAEKRNVPKGFFIPAIFCYVVILFCITVNAITGADWGIGLLSAELLIFTALIIRKYRQL